MRGTRQRDHHRPAGLIRRAAAVLAAAGLISTGGLAGAALGQDAARVRFPTGQDAVAIAPGANLFLLGHDFEERSFPGTVADRERILVELSTDGSPNAVIATQRLTLTGTGDYSFRIPGPATTVEALPDSASRPGLRIGSVIWQGFVAGERVLGARMELIPGEEAARLPLRFTLTMRVNGHPFEAGRSATGPFELVLKIDDVSAIDTRIADADADPAEAAAALDAIRAALLGGTRPEPGRGGVPKAVAATDAPSVRQEPIEAPMRITGRIGFGSEHLTNVRVAGGRARPNGGSTLVSFDRLLGGGRSTAHTVRITGTAHGLSLPVLEVAARPAPPAAVTVKPPGESATWADAVAAGTAADGRAMLATAMSAMWRVARLRIFDGYVGNPDPNGPVSTSYLFRLAPASFAPAAGPIPPGRSLGAFGMALAGVAVAALLFAVGLQWAHA